MLITKSIQTGLDIQSPIDVYSDARTNIMNILRDKYQGKCHFGCYVKSIVDIVNISECIMSSEGSNVYGKVNIQFEIEAIVYVPDEIINGCIVVNKDKKGIIVAQSEYAAIYLNAHPALASITKGQIISVRVSKAIYGGERIAINAKPLMFSRKSLLFHVKSPSLTQSDMAFLTNVLNRIKFEVDKRAEIIAAGGGEGLSFFAKLLNPYMAEQKLESGIEVKSLMELVKSGKELEGYYSRDPRIDPLTDKIAYWKADPSKSVNENYVPKSIDTKGAFLIMLSDYYDYLRTVREMNEIYNTPEKLNAHKNVWLIFAKNKLDKI